MQIKIISFTQQTMQYPQNDNLPNSPSQIFLQIIF